MQTDLRASSAAAPTAARSLPPMRNGAASASARSVSPNRSPSQPRRSSPLPSPSCPHKRQGPRHRRAALRSAPRCGRAPPAATPTRSSSTPAPSAARRSRRSCDRTRRLPRSIRRTPSPRRCCSRASGIARPDGASTDWPVACCSPCSRRWPQRYSSPGVGSAATFGIFALFLGAALLVYFGSAWEAYQHRRRWPGTRLVACAAVGDRRCDPDVGACCSR